MYLIFIRLYKLSKYKIIILLIGAVSSVGRASGLHPEGREFEPLTAHHFIDFKFILLYLVS